MRKIARLALVGVTVAASLLLSGCVQPPAVAYTTPSPTATPLFESDAAALAAATKAYAAYLAMSDLIAQEGGARPERLAPLVTPKWLEKETAAFEDFSSTGNHQEGSSQFDGSRIQEVDRDSDGKTDVVLYLCLDLGSARIFNPSNQDVTPPAVAARTSIEAAFETSADENKTLRLAKNEPWAGKDFC